MTKHSFHKTQKAQKVYTALLGIALVYFSTLLTFFVYKPQWALHLQDVWNLQMPDIVVFQLLHGGIGHYVQNMIALLFVLLIWTEIFSFSSYIAYSSYLVGVIGGFLTLLVFPAAAVIGLSGYILVVLAFEIGHVSHLNSNPYLFFLIVLGLLLLTSWSSESGAVNVPSFVVHSINFALGTCMLILIKQIKSYVDEERSSVLRTVSAP